MNPDIQDSSTDGAQDIDIDEIAELSEILSNQRRVWTLLALQFRNEEEHISVSELADMVAQQQCSAEFGVEDKKRIYIALYQTHIPKLEAVGVVNWDQDSGSVTRGHQFGEVVSALNRLRSEA